MICLVLYISRRFFFELHFFQHTVREYFFVFDPARGFRAGGIPWVNPARGFRASGISAGSIPGGGPAWGFRARGILRGRGRGDPANPCHTPEVHMRCDGAEVKQL